MCVKLFLTSVTRRGTKIGKKKGGREISPVRREEQFETRESELVRVIKCIHTTKLKRLEYLLSTSTSCGLMCFSWILGDSRI